MRMVMHNYVRLTSDVYALARSDASFNCMAWRRIVCHFVT